MTFLLDTNTCIVAMNDVVGRARSRVREEERKGRALLISSVSVLELFYGAYKSARVEVNVAKLRAFLELLTQTPFDPDDAETAGAIRADLEKKGRPIGAYDTLIAGQALRRGLTLVTDNEGEFRRVSGLKIENWVR
jgi:tRNA(fMet)-specific endonuclease VapC